ncbi:MAG: hypothetical protein LBJ73_01410 [Rickettsiales bacterium]|jgi:hypothetical protein|nr:hypothetical protein [Rickettsiales bacterium]
MKTIHKSFLLSLVVAPLMFLSCKGGADDKRAGFYNGKVLLKNDGKVYVSTVPGDTIPDYVIDFYKNDWTHMTNLGLHRLYMDVINVDDSVTIYDIRFVKHRDMPFRARSHVNHYLSIDKVNGVPIGLLYEQQKFSKKYRMLKDSVEKSK